MWNIRIALLATISLLLPLGGCGADAPRRPARESGADSISNRIPIPADVVSNIGITFREARRGRLENRMAVPGRLVVPPEAMWDLRAPFAGTLSMKRRVGDHIAQGEVVAEIVSDELRTLQRVLWEEHASERKSVIDEKHAQVELAGLQKLADAAGVALARAGEREGRARVLQRDAEALVEAAAGRYEELRRLSGESLGRRELLDAQRAWVDAQSMALDARERADAARAEVLRLEVAEVNATVRASTAPYAIETIREQVIAARVSYKTKLAFLSILSGISVDDLMEEVDGLHRWARLSAIPLAAPAAGVISKLAAAHGEWVAAGGSIVEIVDHRELLFEGHLPEVDAAKVKAGTPVRIAPAVEGVAPTDTTISRVYPVAHAEARTITIHARIPNPEAALPAGVTALASILLSVSEAEEVLVPSECVVQDDLETIVFLQDREDPEKVIRLPIAIGRRSADWIEVLAEVEDGDKLVANGIHQLREAGSGKAPSGGHFHSDGTWHAGDE